MIHLHSMFSSETNTSVIGPNGGAPLSQARLESFHGALSDAVSSTLEKFGIHPNDVKISITPANTAATPAASTSSGKATRTAPPTPGASSSSAGTSASSASPSSSATSSQAPNGGYDPFLQAAYNNPYQSATVQTSAQPASGSTAKTNAAPLDAQQAFDDAYWASQPPAVQALQTIQNPEQRTALATQLASEGYSIDVPIMVWGWDPSITMAMRQADGYTWVPSALQNPVEDAPGLATMGTFAAYSANNPPAGSIAVS
jgi:hypothetical protein